MNSKPMFYDIIVKAANTWKIDPNLMFAICEHESSFRPNATNHGPGDATLGGAYGLFQVTLRTAKGLGYTGDGEGLLDPATNANLAARLLHQISQRKGYSVEDVICAYNSGKPRASAPSSTLTHYLPSVLANLKHFQALLGSGAYAADIDQ